MKITTQASLEKKLHLFNLPARHIKFSKLYVKKFFSQGLQRDNDANFFDLLRVLLPYMLCVELILPTYK